MLIIKAPDKQIWNSVHVYLNGIIRPLFHLRVCFLLKFEFNSSLCSTGERPVVAKGTLAELEIEEAKTEINPDEWKATLEDKRGDIADIIVSVSNTMFLLTVMGHLAKSYDYCCQCSFLLEDLY